MVQDFTCSRRQYSIGVTEMAWYGNTSGRARTARTKSAGNLAGMYGQFEDMGRPTRGRGRPAPKPMAKPAPRGRGRPAPRPMARPVPRKPTAMQIKEEAKQLRQVVEPRKKPQKVMARAPPVSTEASMPMSRPVPRRPSKPVEMVKKLIKPARPVPPAVKKMEVARKKIAQAPVRSRVKTGTQRLKEVKTEQKVAARAQKKQLAVQKKVAPVATRGPVPTQLRKIQQQKQVAKTAAPLKRKPSSPRVDPSIQRAIATKKAAPKPSPMARPVPRPTVQTRMKDALKSKARPTKQTPENYQDLIKRTGTKAPTKPTMRLDVMEKKRKVMDRMAVRKPPTKAPDYMDVIKQAGTKKAVTPLEQAKFEKKITKINDMKRKAKVRPVPIKPFVVADKKVETKIDPRTKAITVEKKVRGKVVERKSFTPMKAKQAMATRKKMEKEVVKQDVKESQKPMTKKIRNLTIKLVPVVEEKKSVAQKAKEGLGFFFNTTSKFNEGRPAHNTRALPSRNLTPRQKRLEEIYFGSGNVGGWY